MSLTLVPSEDWLLTLTGAVAADLPEAVHQVIAEHSGSLIERERACFVKTGTPILIAPDLTIDERLIDYFARSIPFTEQAAEGRSTYARELRIWFEFLWSRNKHWDEASERDFVDFKRWRTDPDLRTQVGGQGIVVSSATFNKAVNALTAFYDWATRRSFIEQSPVPARSAVGRGLREPRQTNARSVRYGWVTPRTYQVWRDVGLLGYQMVRDGRGVSAGSFDERWRGGRNLARDRAFCDLMITSALRRREQSSMLLHELPTDEQDVVLASATAKNQRARVWTPLGHALDQTHSYVRLGRAAAVQRALNKGRYEQAGHMVVVEVRPSRSGDEYVLDSGVSGLLADLRVDQRLRLFEPDENGQLVPMSLWLGDDGKPMTMRGWNKVFGRANDRVLSEFTRLGLRSDTSIRLTLHSLRFSFALYLLAALHHQIDVVEGYRVSDPYDERRYEQAYDVIRDLLGHARVQTTKETYLEPVKGLRRALLFDQSAAMRSLSEMIEDLASGSATILDARLMLSDEAE